MLPSAGVTACVERHYRGSLCQQIAAAHSECCSLTSISPRVAGERCAMTFGSGRGPVFVKDVRSEPADIEAVMPLDALISPLIAPCAHRSVRLQ